MLLATRHKRTHPALGSSWCSTNHVWSQHTVGCTCSTGPRGALTGVSDTADQLVSRLRYRTSLHHSDVCVQVDDDTGGCRLACTVSAHNSVHCHADEHTPGCDLGCQGSRSVCLAGNMSNCRTVGHLDVDILDDRSRTCQVANNNFFYSVLFAVVYPPTASILCVMCGHLQSDFKCSLNQLRNIFNMNISYQKRIALALLLSILREKERAIIM